MNSGGESKPSDIQVLYDTSLTQPDKIIFGQRAKQSEGLFFRTAYSIYKLLFGILTGSVIKFGNFSIIPHRQAKKLAYFSEIWSHFPRGIIRSKLPYSYISQLSGECDLRVNLN